MDDCKSAPGRMSAGILDALDRVRHGFFTREGGFSEGIYASLNCGLGSNDRREVVEANRAAVARSLGVEPQCFVTPYQHHGNVAVAITGEEGPEAARPRSDALVTDRTGVALGVGTADCAPVLFAASDPDVIGAAHAGWKGALGGILEATVATMEGLGANRSSIRAVVGPCISRCNYEVGEEFQARFVQHSPAYARYFDVPVGRERAHFDLARFAADRLLAAGVGRTEVLDACTYAGESRFFSYRRSTHRGEPDYGRQISAILLR